MVFGAEPLLVLPLELVGFADELLLELAVFAGVGVGFDLRYATAAVFPCAANFFAAAICYAVAIG